MKEIFPENWRCFLGLNGEASGKLDGLLTRIEALRREETVYPPEGQVFTALELLPPEQVKVVLLGQDPYHGEGEAEGLAFSVAPGVPWPPSLRNIFREYAADLGREMPESGSLRNWAKGGVLLLNAVLTVRGGVAGSHAGLGWERWTDLIIEKLSGRRDKIVFLLWGSWAAKKSALIDTGKHPVIKCVHPSPLSAYRGWFGSRPFSRAETAWGGQWRWPELE